MARRCPSSAVCSIAAPRSEGARWVSSRVRGADPTARAQTASAGGLGLATSSRSDGITRERVAARSEVTVLRPTLRGQVSGTLTLSPRIEDRVSTVLEHLHWLAVERPDPSGQPDTGIVSISQTRIGRGPRWCAGGRRDEPDETLYELARRFRDRAKRHVEGRGSGDRAAFSAGRGPLISRRRGLASGAGAPGRRSGTRHRP
jgi:hypothetical protein